MEIIRTHQLSRTQQHAVSDLIHCCQKADHTVYSYPYEEAGCHYLLFTSRQQLVSVFTALESPEPEEMECLAFTLPSMRKRGYFQLLLDTFTEDFPETDIIFPVDHSALAALMVMTALEAECIGTNYLMDLHTSDFIAGSIPDFISDFSLRQDSPNILVLVKDGSIYGSCRLECYETAACLHHVEILPEFRRQGYAAGMLWLLLLLLNKKGIEHLFLHVLADNLPAVSLYKKTGFRITKTLSYYLF